MPPNPPPGGVKSPPVAREFELYDRLTIVALAFFLILAASLFYLHIGRLGLLNFTPPGGSAAQTQSDYFIKALDYRERRLSLVMTYRTFVTTLGFTVGLVLAAIGGIFVLRRARTSFDLSVQPDGGGRAGPTVPSVQSGHPVQAGSANGDPAPGQQTTAQPGVRSAQPSDWKGAGLFLTTTSPGIVFALIGAGIMFFTQYMAIPVGAPELFPASVQPVCTQQQADAGTCSLGISKESSEALQDQIQREKCAANPTLPDCLASGSEGDGRAEP